MRLGTCIARAACTGSGSAGRSRGAGSWCSLSMHAAIAICREKLRLAVHNERRKLKRACEVVEDMRQQLEATQALGVQDLLKTMDAILLRLLKRHKLEQKPFKYVNSLVKALNVWREHAATAYFIWRQVDANTCEHTATMPPRVIPSRWGTKDEGESRMLSLPKDTFVTVMRYTLDKRIRKASKKLQQKQVLVDAAAADPLSVSMEWIMSIEEAQMGGSSQYSDVMGRWAVDALKTYECDLWWY